jgi:hypothetical protein
LVTAYVVSGILLVLMIWLLLWVTKKAYSRKWEE